MAPTLISFLSKRSEAGDAGSAQAPGVGTGSDAGASGDSSANSVDLSTGGLIAIIVVVVVVVIFGGMSAYSLKCPNLTNKYLQSPLQHSS